MANYQIKATCGGTCKKVQTITYEGFDREYVERAAGLLDGTSPLYMIPPDKLSTIGQCETCDGRFTCEVIEAP